MRAHVIVAAIAADILVVVLAVVVLIWRPGPGGDGGMDLGPSGGLPSVNGQIEILRTASGGQRPPLAAGGIGAPMASRPAQTIVTASGAGVRSAPTARVTTRASVPAATCSPSLLQTVLGLVAALLGGRPAC